MIYTKKNISLMNTIKITDYQITTKKEGIKEIWTLKDNNSIYYLRFNGKKWFLKEKTD